MLKQSVIMLTVTYIKLCTDVPSDECRYAECRSAYFTYYLVFCFNLNVLINWLGCLKSVKRTEQTGRLRPVYSLRP